MHVAPGSQKPRCILLFRIIRPNCCIETYFLLQKTLAENVRAFETSKESEKKKLEEERKWVRREKVLFDKSQKDKKSNFERRAQDEVEELQNKVHDKKCVESS